MIGHYMNSSQTHKEGDGSYCDKPKTGKHIGAFRASSLGRLPHATADAFSYTLVNMCENIKMI